jgi:type IV pilus assembly protein PilW
MNLSKFKQAGLSMIELMISITVGLIVVSGVIGMFVSTVTSNAENLKMTRLNQELRAVMDVMVRDIRRAGYRGDSTTATTPNPFTSTANGDDLTARTVNVANDCISFTYDSTALDSPPVTVGVVDNADRFGYRRGLVGAVGVIQSRNGGAGATDCAAGTWSDLSDGDSVDITTLLFNVVPVTLTNPTSGATRTLRSITITLTGQIRGSNPAINRTITETVQMVNS